MLALPTIKFCKMQGLGNDFMVIDGINQQLIITPATANLLADRHLGVGFDQLLLIEKSQQADFFCRIFNADGSEAEQCGNGMRCVARFIHEQKLLNKNTFTIETKAGILNIIIHQYDEIEVNMGIPDFSPTNIPFVTDQIQKLYPLKMDYLSLEMTVLSMGNPHAIIRVSELAHFPVYEIGSKIAILDVFPQSVNVGFIEIINRQKIRLRTFERGSQETFACGSNACAAVVAGVINGWLEHKVTVELTYGNLQIEWQGENKPVIMTGPAVQVFSGELIFANDHSVTA